MSECLDKFDLLGGKRASLFPLQSENADNRSFAQQRHTESAAYVDDAGESLKPTFVELEIGEKIRNMNRVAGEYSPAEDRTTVRFRGVAGKLVTLLGGQAESRLEGIQITLAPANNPQSASQTRAANFDQGVEHRLQVERRSADDFEHVGCRRLLLE